MGQGLGVGVWGEWKLPEIPHEAKLTRNKQKLLIIEVRYHEFRVAQISKVVELFKESKSLTDSPIWTGGKGKHLNADTLGLGMMDLEILKKNLQSDTSWRGLFLRSHGTTILDDKVQWEVMAKMKGKPWSLVIQKLGDLEIKVTNVSTIWTLKSFLDDAVGFRKKKTRSWLFNLQWIM